MEDMEMRKEKPENKEKKMGTHSYSGQATMKLSIISFKTSMSTKAMKHS